MSSQARASTSYPGGGAPVLWTPLLLPRALEWMGKDRGGLWLVCLGPKLPLSRPLTWDQSKCWDWPSNYHILARVHGSNNDSKRDNREDWLSDKIFLPTYNKSIVFNSFHLILAIEFPFAWNIAWTSLIFKAKPNMSWPGSTVSVSDLFSDHQ